jgi:hypothetical protein
VAASEVTGMAGFARWVWQEGIFIGTLIFTVAFYGYLIIPAGFDITVIAAGASTCLLPVTVRAARARHTVALAISLPVLVALLGVFSAGMLAHSRVHLLTIGAVASLYLSVVISVVQSWRSTRPPHPPS